MQIDKREALQNTVTSGNEVYKKWLMVLNDEKTNQPVMQQQGAMTLWSFHVQFALKAFFIDNDILQAKQEFYTCGKLDEFVITTADAKTLDSGINHLACALLSDSPSLIQRYASLKHSVYEQSIQRGEAAPLYILQCLLKDDWAEYERVMPVVKNKVVPKFKMELDEAFYQAVAEKNQPRMEALLTEIVSPKEHSRRSKHYPLINQFISYHGLCYAKLAWLKGIPVEVSSPLVPKELLPAAPLLSYKAAYNFLLADE